MICIYSEEQHKLLLLAFILLYQSKKRHWGLKHIDYTCLIRSGKTTCWACKC